MDNLDNPLLPSSYPLDVVGVHTMKASIAYVPSLRSFIYAIIPGKKERKIIRRMMGRR